MHDTTGPGCWRIDFVSAAQAANAVSILREAAGWASRFGAPIWNPDSFTVGDYRAFADAGELVGGFEGPAMVACMLLQSRDPVYWPDDPPHSALYLHKIAVRRSAAGQGWLRRLVTWALAEARNRGAEAIRLDTLPSGRLPVLYGALGFRVVDATPRQYAGRWAIRMELRL